jgi:hypothetical protein
MKIFLGVFFSSQHAYDGCRMGKKKKINRARVNEFCFRIEQKEPSVTISDRHSDLSFSVCYA